MGVILRRGQECQIASKRWQDVRSEVAAWEQIAQAGFKLVELRQHLRLQQFFASLVPACEITMQREAADQIRYGRQWRGIGLVGGGKERLTGFQTGLPRQY